VVKESPAARAGIMRGDIVLEFNGKEIKDVSTLRNLVAQSKTGTEITMRILRAGKEFVVKVGILELPREVAEILPDRLPNDPEARVLTGLTVMDLSKEIVKQLGFNKDEKGVVVVRVEPGSAADEAEIKKGDIIKEMNKKEIVNLEDFNKAATGIKKNESVLLFVNRSGKKFYVILKAT